MAGKQGQKSNKATEIAKRFNQDFLGQLDGRVRVAKSLRDRLAQLTSDLGGDLSYMERSLCRRIVFLERHVEKKELSLAHGGTVAETDYISSINCLSGLFGKIGISRRARPVQSVQEYMAARTAPAEEAP